MFVDVPINVQVPPRIDAYASGIRSLDGLTFNFFETLKTGATNKAVTVVLFMNAESAPTTLMRMSRKRFELRPENWNKRCAMALTNPLRCNAPVIIKIDARIIMMSLLKPEKACSGERI